MSRSRKKDYRVVPTSDNEGNKAKYQKNLDEVLKPKMTLLNGCTVIIGSIIGSRNFCFSIRSFTKYWQCQYVPYCMGRFWTL